MKEELKGVSSMRYIPGVCLDPLSYHESILLKRDQAGGVLNISCKRAWGTNNQGESVLVMQMEDDEGSGALIIERVGIGEKREIRYGHNDNNPG